MVNLIMHLNEYGCMEVSELCGWPNHRNRPATTVSNVFNAGIMKKYGFILIAIDKALERIYHILIRKLNPINGHRRIAQNFFFSSFY